MHDPYSLICELKIRIPFRKKSWENYIRFAEIWHKDPCCDGTDDSCGRFMRARHGKESVLKSIMADFTHDWDRVFKSEETGNIFHCGYFCPNGDPAMSVHGIVLNLFLIASCRTLGSRKKAVRYLNANLFEILLFAENPVDSICNRITRKFSTDAETEHERAARIASLASTIYSYILRDTRPWYKSPNLHIHHWRIVFPWLRDIKRLLFERCSKCKKSLGYKKSVVSDWGGQNKTCYRCSGPCATITK